MNSQNTKCKIVKPKIRLINGYWEVTPVKTEFGTYSDYYFLAFNFACDLNKKILDNEKD